MPDEYNIDPNRLEDYLAIMNQTEDYNPLTGRAWGSPQYTYNPGGDPNRGPTIGGVTTLVDNPIMLGGQEVSAPWYSQQRGIDLANRPAASFEVGTPESVALVAMLPALISSLGSTAAVGDVGSEGYGISPDFLSGGLPEVGGGATGTLAGEAAPSALWGDIGLTAAEDSALLGGAGAAAGATSALAPSGLPSGIVEGMAAPEGAGLASGEAAAFTPASPAGGGIFSQIGDMVKGGLKNPDGSINWANAIKLGTGATSMLGSLTGGGNQQLTPTMPAGWNDPARYVSMSRERAPAMAEADYATYGTKGGEHRFFNDPVYTPKADGGHVRGPGTGRSDDIDAKLSDGEYVIDAESVALLGDGSTDEGSRRLDELRANLRKHKGSALSKGKFSPAARDPMHYMGGKAKGGLLNPQAVDVSVRNKELLARSMGRSKQKLDISGMSEEELKSYRQFLERLRTMAPPQKAKGGLTRITGGIPVDPQMRLEQLAATQRLEAAFRAKQAASELNPPSPAIQNDRAMVEAARQRLKMIRSLADSTPSPVKKAEGGAVKALTEFADRLEETTPELPVLAE